VFAGPRRDVPQADPSTGLIGTVGPSRALARWVRGATRWLTPPGTVSMRTAGDGGALGVPLPGAQSAGEEELPGAGSGLGEDGFEVVPGGVL